MEKFDHLPELPGPPQYQAWVKERLETLSVKEERVLAAASMRYPPESAEDAINCLQSLDNYSVYLAGNYEELGRQYLSQVTNLPENVLPYVDFERIGKEFENRRPGLFIGSCYVVYPKGQIMPVYSQQNTLLPDDDAWSVKLKLASPAVPEGVWLRMPGYGGNTIEELDEVVLALDDLKVESLEDCTLLEAKCILPEAGDLMKQYTSIADLIRDGDNLSYVLYERGQGESHWMEKFAAALEYENCRTLKFALDISQNMHCYEWISSEGLADFAARHLRDESVPEELIQSGVISLDEYAKDLLETSGYMEASGETGYLIRNSREFIRDFTAPVQDILKAFPFLEKLSKKASPEEAAAARTAISEALAKYGDSGPRQLQAAMEFEDCATLEEAVEIAGRLDSYEFVEIGSFRETAEKELLAKGLDKRVIDLCVNFETYAAITHDFEDIYSSHDTGLYVHRNDAMSQPSQGMTMQ